MKNRINYLRPTQNEMKVIPTFLFSAILMASGCNMGTDMVQSDDTYSVVRTVADNSVMGYSTLVPSVICRMFKG